MYSCYSSAKTSHCMRKQQNKLQRSMDCGMPKEDTSRMWLNELTRAQRDWRSKYGACKGMHQLLCVYFIAISLLFCETQQWSGCVSICLFLGLFSFYWVVLPILNMRDFTLNFWLLSLGGLREGTLIKTCCMNEESISFFIFKFCLHLFFLA